MNNKQPTIWSKAHLSRQISRHWSVLTNNWLVHTFVNIRSLNHAAHNIRLHAVCAGRVSVSIQYIRTYNRTLEDQIETARCTVIIQQTETIKDKHHDTEWVRMYSLVAVCVKPEDGCVTEPNCDTDTGGANIYNNISLLEILQLYFQPMHPASLVQHSGMISSLWYM